jgi:hypothetical protein
MSTPPGEPPGQQPGEPGQQPDPTQPLGYWQQQPPPGWSQQGYPPQYPPQAYGQPPFRPADHPRATTALVLGLVAIVGGFTCGLPLIVGPWAWGIGRRAVREIDQEPHRYGGRGMAMAGYVMGVIATILLVLGVLALVAIILIAIAVPGGGFSEGGVGV